MAGCVDATTLEEEDDPTEKEEDCGILASGSSRALRRASFARRSSSVKGPLAESRNEDVGKASEAACTSFAAYHGAAFDPSVVSPSFQAPSEDGVFRCRIVLTDNFP